MWFKRKKPRLPKPGTYRVAIRNNKTQEVRMREIDMPWGEGSLFWWTDGNFGCGCNRELEWRRAKEKSVELESGEYCSNGRFSVLYAELSDGTIEKIDED